MQRADLILRQLDYNASTSPVPQNTEALSWTTKALKELLGISFGRLMGFDTLTFTPIFVAARITGWTAHIMEQLQANALIRPLSAYNGVDERHL